VAIQYLWFCTNILFLKFMVWNTKHAFRHLMYHISKLYSLCLEDGAAIVQNVGNCLRMDTA
jgi:hypothetical protein